MSQVNTPLHAWGTHHNFVDLKAPIGSAPLASVSDRLSISDLIARYSWAYDERREDIMQLCFSDDATFSGSIAGDMQFGPFQGTTVITNWLKDTWESQSDQRRHCVMNLVIDDLTDRSASASAFVLISAAQNNAVRLATSGFYRFALEKVAGSWKIQTMFVGLDIGF